jgi:outer membrane protein assembly factor BamB
LRNLDALSQNQNKLKFVENTFLLRFNVILTTDDQSVIAMHDAGRKYWAMKTENKVAEVKKKQERQIEHQVKEVL